MNTNFSNAGPKENLSSLETILPAVKSCAKSLALFYGIRVILESAPLICVNPFMGAVGLTIGFAAVYYGKDFIPESINDFKKLCLASKIGTVSLGVIFGFLIPVLSNSLYSFMTPAKHLLLLPLTTIITLLIVPGAKAFDKEIATISNFNVNRKIKRLECERDIWRIFAIYFMARSFNTQSEEEEPKRPSIIIEEVD